MHESHLRQHDLKWRHATLNMLAQGHKKFIWQSPRWLTSLECFMTYVAEAEISVGGGGGVALEPPEDLA